MKKLVFGIAVSVIIFAFKPKDDTKIIHSPPEKMATLNGYTKSEANELVKYCVTTSDRSPKHTQVWFRKEIIEAWYTLLLEDKNRGIKADGIRIYISRTKPSNANPIHLNNGIVITSTLHLKDTVINGKTISIHKDYFNHLESSPLFSLNSINGEISHDKNASNGALLFNTCHCDLPDSCAITEHDIPRSVAEKMVHRFRRIPIIRQGSINSRSEWFNMKMIKDLINEMNISGCDGIRIYFARGIQNDYTKRKAKFVITVTSPKNNNTIHEDVFDCKRHAFINKSGGFDNGELCPDHCDGVTLPEP